MDLETIANAIDSSKDPNMALIERLLTSTAYYFPTLAAPSIIYSIVKRTVVRNNTTTNPLTTALIAAAIGTLPLGFLAGALTNDAWLGLHNAVAYLFGSVFAAYQHYSQLPASQPAQAPTK